MEIRNNNTCINCENLLSNFMCSKHNKSVEITNSCEKHMYKQSITKNSSCSNCNHYNTESCTKPEEASEKMICFDWKSN